MEADHSRYHNAGRNEVFLNREDLLGTFAFYQSTNALLHYTDIVLFVKFRAPIFFVFLVVKRLHL